MVPPSLTCIVIFSFAFLLIDSSPMFCNKACVDSPICNGNCHRYFDYCNGAAYTMFARYKCMACMNACEQCCKERKNQIVQNNIEKDFDGKMVIE